MLAVALGNGGRTGGHLFCRAPHVQTRVLGSSRSFPVEEIDFFQGGGLVVEQEDLALAVGPVGRVQEVRVWRIGGGLADAAHVPDRPDGLLTSVKAAV